MLVLGTATENHLDLDQEEGFKHDVTSTADGKFAEESASISQECQLLVPYRIELGIASTRDDYREKGSGKGVRGPATSRFFPFKNWNKQAFRFTFAKEERTIPKNYEWLVASLEVYPTDRSDTKSLSNPMHGYAVGHAIGNPTGFRDEDFLITNASKTVATARIEQNQPFRKGSHNRLVDVTNIVKEILTRDDYVERNPFEIFLMAEENDPSHREVYAYSRTYGTSRAAKLIVLYTDPQPVVSASPGGPYYTVAGCELEVDGSNSTATLSSGPIEKYTWDFGDGTIKTSECPITSPKYPCPFEKHRYLSSDELTITLTIETSQGDRATNTTTANVIHVNPFHTTNHEITMSMDDYVETWKGNMKTKATKHNMWNKWHKFQAYRFNDTFIQPAARIQWAVLEMKAIGNVGKNISGRVFAAKVGNAPPFQPSKRRQLSKARKTRARAEISDPPRWK